MAGDQPRADVAAGDGGVEPFERVEHIRARRVLVEERARFDIRIKAALLLLHGVGEAARVGGGIGQTQFLVGVVADADRDSIEFRLQGVLGSRRRPGIGQPHPRRLAREGVKHAQASPSMIKAAIKTSVSATSERRPCARHWTS